MKILILILSLTIFAHSCNTFYDFGHSPCTFHISYLDAYCQNFAFSHCSWVRCAERSYACDTCYCARQETITEASWVGCTQKCCDDSVAYDKNAGAIKQCQDFLDWQFAKKMIIGFTVSFGTVFIVILILIYCSCCGPYGQFSACGNRIRAVCAFLYTCICCKC